MNFIKIFTREESIAGLEISETHLKLAFLTLETSHKKEQPTLRIKALTEEPLPGGTIQDGEVLDREALTASLIKLLNKSPSVKYFIVSIPGNKLYQKIFPFPQTILEERLVDAMKLVTTFQLPYAEDTAYVDWEKLSNDLHNEVFLATAPKTVVEGFLSALDRAGVKTVALESHTMSLARVVEHEDQPILVCNTGKTDITFSVVKNGIPRFERIIPTSLLGEKSMSMEMEKIKKFYEVEWREVITRVIELPHVSLFHSLALELKRFGGENNTTAWAIALGAAMRGLLPRAEDTIVSILPVGTEKAYEYQKAVAFSKFITNTTIGLALFWTAIFFSSWILLSAIQQYSNKELSSLSSLPSSAENLALEDRAHEFNALARRANSIIATFPAWSMVVEDVKAHSVKGITITNVSFATPDSLFSLTGIAATRADINIFKKSMETSKLFTEMTIPLTNLEQRANISFSATFRMIDPNVLYQGNK